MDIVKVTEVIASSETGFDEAIRNCVNEVAKTIRNIDLCKRFQSAFKGK